MTKVLCALDIGLYKVICCIAHVKDTLIEVIGTGYCPSKGMSLGVILDPDELASCISHAVQAAEDHAKESIREVFVNISTPNMCSLITKACVKIDTVTEENIVELKKKAEEKCPADHVVLHTINIAYELDDMVGIRSPVGMVGKNLTGFFTIITAPLGYVRNIIACFEKCHLQVAGIGADPVMYTRAQNSITKDPLIIDFGASCTSFALTHNNLVVYAKVIPIGGMNVTMDIVNGLGLSYAQAERLKTLYGNALFQESDAVYDILIKDDGHDLSISSNNLNYIINARIEEIVAKIIQDLQGCGLLEAIGSNIVVCGGGANLSGLTHYVQTAFDRPTGIVRLPQLKYKTKIMFVHNMHVVAGLLLYAVDVAKKEKTSIWHRIRKFLIGD